MVKLKSMAKREAEDVFRRYDEAIKNFPDSLDGPTWPRESIEDRQVL